MVIPYQVNWQFVATKSQGLVHVAGAESAAVGAFVGIMRSAACASTAWAAPMSANMIAAKLPRLTRVPPSPPDFVHASLSFAPLSLA
jgi:hypothetical protein